MCLKFYVMECVFVLYTYDSNLQLCDVFTKSLMWMQNNSEDKIPPCGTPWEICNDSQVDDRLHRSETILFFCIEQLPTTANNLLSIFEENFHQLFTDGSFPHR